MFELTEAKYLSKAPINYHSIIGKGRTDTCEAKSVLPDSDAADSDGADYMLNVKLLAESDEIDSDLRYNEFVVYDVCQIKIQYLILVKFNFV